MYYGQFMWSVIELCVVTFGDVRRASSTHPVHRVPNWNDADTQRFPPPPLPLTRVDSIMPNKTDNIVLMVS